MPPPRVYPFPLGGGVVRGSGTAPAGSSSGATVSATVFYNASQAALVNSGALSLYCQSGVVSEANGTIFRAKGTVKVTSTGTPDMTIGMMRTDHTLLTTVTVTLGAVVNKYLYFDLWATLEGTAGSGSFGSRVLDQSPTTARVWAAGITNSIIGDPPYSPLWVSLQWSVADPANSAQLQKCLWEIYTPASVV